MSFSILERSEKFIQKRAKRRRWAAVFGCLAVVAAVGTGYMLKRNGEAMNYELRELYCTCEIHEHTDQCYDSENELVCGKADYVLHVHNDDCYDGNGELLCELTETEIHKHEEECFEEVPVLICEEEGIEADVITGEGAEGDVSETQPEGAEADVTQPEGTDGTVSETQPDGTDGMISETQPEGADGTVSETQPEGTDGTVSATQPEETDGAASASQPEKAEGTTSAPETVGTEETQSKPAQAETQPAVQQNEVTETQPASQPETAVAQAQSASESKAAAEPAGQSAEAAKTVQKELTCTTEEHSHSDSCYGKEMTCSESEHTHDADCHDEEGELTCSTSEHTHGDGCYTKELNCDKTEHTHSDGCYSSVSTGTDSPAEAPKPAPKPEKPSGSGNAAAPEKPAAPENATAPEKPAETESAMAPEGTEGTEQAETTEEVGETADETAVEEPDVHIHTEECYEMQMQPVCGYQEAHEHRADCYDDEELLICGLLELEEHVHDENCFEILEPAAGRRTVVGDGYTVTVSYGVDAGLPEKVELYAEEIKPRTDAYEAYREQAMEAMGEAEETEISGRLFDIGFTLNEKEIEPKASVHVEISYQDEEPKILLEEPKVVHFAGEEEVPEVIEAETEEGAYIFTTDGFSPMFVATNALDFENLTVKIEDTIAEDGCLHAVINDNNNEGETEKSIDVEVLKRDYTVKFIWLKKEADSLDSGSGEFFEVGRTLVVEPGQYDVAEYGEWLNVALNQGAGCEYKVKLIIGNKENSDEEIFSGESEEYKIPYYAELRNGNFEEPQISGGNVFENISTDNTNLYWKTTAFDEKVKLVNIGNEAESLNDETSGWNGVMVDANGGKQFAEINATAEGVLYQTVLVTPGTTLNWEFFHRAGRTLENTELDELYMVIMPESIAADEYADYTELKELLKHKTGGKQNIENSSEIVENDGILIARVRSDAQSWHEYNGIYTVPQEEYLIRILFMADVTSNGNVTEGNFIDKVWFSTEIPAPPPVPAGKARLYIVKIAEGLSKDELWCVNGTDTQEKLQFMPDMRSSNGGDSGGVSPDHILGEKFTWHWDDRKERWVGIYYYDDLLSSASIQTSKEGTTFQTSLYAVKEQNYLRSQDYTVDPWVKQGYYTQTFGLDSVEDISDIEWAEYTGSKDESGFASGSNTDLDSKLIEIRQETDSEGVVTVTHGIAVFRNKYFIKNKNKLEIVKTSSQDESEQLEGAEFEVRADDKVIASGITNSNGSVILAIGNLYYDKLYMLREIKAPKDYIQLSDDIYFKLSKIWAVTEWKDGVEEIKEVDSNVQGAKSYIKVIFCDEDGEKIDTPSYIKPVKLLNEWGDTITITVKNEPKVILPETGGSGTTYYTYIGIAVLTLGLIYGWNMKKKRERRAG